MSEEATLVVQLPKVLEKQLRAHYDTFTVSTTTLQKWTREGMPTMVIDGVTLYDKRAVTRWLKQYER